MNNWFWGTILVMASNKKFQPNRKNFFALRVIINNFKKYHSIKEA
jgi:hypothetical protein